jgi:hypothetical protein
VGPVGRERSYLTHLAHATDATAENSYLTYLAHATDATAEIYLVHPE